MKRYVKYALVIGTLSLCAALSLAAEEKGAAGGRQGRRAGRATSRPAYVDKEHAPRPRDKEWIKLFDGKDLDGWKFFPTDRPNSWKVTDGIMESALKEGQHGLNAYTTQQFEDFEFYCEFKVPKDGNSGIFLRGLYEVQIRGDYGMKLDDPKIDWGTGAFYNQKKPLKNASKPADEWQSIYAKVVGDKATVYVNGVLVQDNFVLAKPTHQYSEMKDVKEGGPGPIILQGDHKPIQFRYVMIKPIKK
jgi:hypothetical protein